MKTWKDDEREREGRRADRASTHAPDGERGEGNPRAPQRDLRREGDVLTPDMKEPTRAPDLRRRVQESNADSKPGAPGDGSKGQEADPPKPRKEEEPREVPPYAGKRQRGRTEEERKVRRRN